MLDFDIEWRPWRAVFIALIASAIFYVTSDWIPATISLLGYFDIEPNKD